LIGVDDGKLTIRMLDHLRERVLERFVRSGRYRPGLVLNQVGDGRGHGSNNIPHGTGGGYPPSYLRIRRMGDVWREEGLRRAAGRFRLGCVPGPGRSER
jgi:hypothetical protein